LPQEENLPIGSLSHWTRAFDTDKQEEKQVCDKQQEEEETNKDFHKEIQ
jgi:hypothetical protein